MRSNTGRLSAITVRPWRTHGHDDQSSHPDVHKSSSQALRAFVVQCFFTRRPNTWRLSAITIRLWPTHSHDDQTSLWQIGSACIVCLACFALALSSLLACFNTYFITPRRTEILLLILANSSIPILLCTAAKREATKRGFDRRRADT